jgi:hypothetical protein
MLMQHLDLRRVFYYRQNSGAVWDGKRPVRLAPKGCSDIVAIVDGYYVAFEVKTPAGKQTADQRAWQQSVEAARGFYFVVREPADVDRALQEIRGARRPAEF